jgi:hypothetical protein
MTLTAGVQTNLFLLDGVVGKIPFGFAMIRSSVAGTSQGYNTLTALGTSNVATLASYDIVNPSGVGQLNHGTVLTFPVDASILASRYLKGQMIPINQPIIPIIHCSSVDRALMGDQSVGFRYYNAAKDYLMLKPDANFSSGTYTVDFFYYFFQDMIIDQGKINLA